MLLSALLASIALALAACADRGETAQPREAPAGLVTSVAAGVADSVTAVAVIPTAAELPVGRRLTLGAIAQDLHGRPIPGSTASWTTSDSAVAIVSPTGEVTARRRGSATISAHVSGKSASARVRVTSGGIPIRPGDDIQAAVDRHPEGTRFLIKAGVHKRQSIAPKEGNAFIGEPGAVLDGENATMYAFRNDGEPHPSNVRIQGLIIEHYKPPPQSGAILAGGPPVGETTGWVVEDCEIRHNATGGIRLGDAMRVLRNNIHHNGQIGMLGSGDSVLVEGNEIAYNNHQQEHDFNWEAGGTKFARTKWLVARGNYVHHNWGIGLWTDIDNITTLYEHNRVEDNASSGIFHEISYDAVIRGNIARRNGHAPQADDVAGGGIVVTASSDVEIAGNLVEANANGITALDRDRGMGLVGPYVLKNLYVHDNLVTMTRGITGLVVGGLRSFAAFRSRNNRFERNSYSLGPKRRYFHWMRLPLTEEQWQSFGQDTAGTFKRLVQEAAQAR